LMRNATDTAIKSRAAALQWAMNISIASSLRQIRLGQLTP
jgi:hypothetical protein